MSGLRALILLVVPLFGATPPANASPTHGRLPPETIQRVMRESFGRFRVCYERALRPCPNLAGRVVVRFVIGRDGSVTSARDGGSDVPDRSVVECVVRSVRTLKFPPPEGGPVTVVYPISFAPG